MIVYRMGSCVKVKISKRNIKVRSQTKPNLWTVCLTGSTENITLQVIWNELK